MLSVAFLMFYVLSVVVQSGNSYLRGRLSTIDLQLLLILKTSFFFYKTSYPNEEVNRTSLPLQLVFPAPTNMEKCANKINYGF